MPRQFHVQVNGKSLATVTDEQRPLLDVLREDWHLTGTKLGCGEGECGACTVLVDGKPTRSCLTTISQVADGSVQTIEGLATETAPTDGTATEAESAAAGEPRKLHVVQQAFLDHQAMQCGYCVPGHIMTAVALVRDNPRATRAQIIETMSQHICRCCNYENILAAVEAAVASAAADKVVD